MSISTCGWAQRADHHLIIPKFLPVQLLVAGYFGGATLTVLVRISYSYTSHDESWSPTQRKRHSFFPTTAPPDHHPSITRPRLSAPGRIGRPRPYIYYRREIASIN